MTAESAYGAWTRRGEDVSRVVELAAPLYLLFVGFFGHRIPRDDYLLVAPLLFLIWRGLWLLIGRARSPKPLRSIAWLWKLTSTSSFWVVSVVLYMALVGFGSWVWVERLLDQPPIIEIVRAQNTLLPLGGETILRVSARDPEDSELRCRWAADDGEVPNEAPCAAVVPYHAPMSPGQRQITVTVIDRKGNEATRSVVIDVGP